MYLEPAKNETPILLPNLYIMYISNIIFSFYILTT